MKNQITTLLETVIEIRESINSAVKILHKHSGSREQMTRQQVKEYLGISETTYKRKVQDGILKPKKMPGGDRFFKDELISEFLESKKRGRV